MGGGWVGYLYVFIACGVMLLLTAAATALLYFVARLRRRAGRTDPRVRVTPLARSANAPGPEAADGDDEPGS